MKFTLDWLSEYVSVEGLNLRHVADRLTMLGLEVDCAQILHTGLDNILVAKILEVQPHPHADKLKLCQVATGSDPVMVVCGAANAREGLLTALAPAGTILPSGQEITANAIMGIMSHGMLCSAKELGISEDHSGIMELTLPAQPGEKLVEALKLRDEMIEIDLTPNRPDCASLLGIAREVAGFSRRTLTPPLTTGLDLQEKHPDFAVEIEKPKLCPRYSACKIIKVTIGPSPWWLQRRLLAVGMRPINNVVDVTNYVMLEYGQPLHAFDFHKIKNHRIVVRCPREDEKSFTTLDGNTRNLEADMLMICDGEAPVALAGIMGGMNSEISADTTEILLESANFNPVSIRKTARNLNLTSESSYRFERGVDPEAATNALERAANLIAELAGGEIVAGGIDLYPGKKAPLTLELRVKRVGDLLGLELSAEQIAAHLRAIEFRVEVAAGQPLRVTVPTCRVDIEREADLIEEVARLVGYDNIPVTQPRIAMDYPERDKLRLFRRDVAAHLVALGFGEAINYSFVAQKHYDHCGLAQDDPRRQTVQLLNPLTEEQAVMRTMLLPALLENIRHNLNHQQNAVKLFEIGKVFRVGASQEQPAERFQLCAAISGERYAGGKPYYFSGLQSDYFDIKGIAESLIHHLRLQGACGTLRFSSASDAGEPYGESGSFCRIMDGDELIGSLGQLNKNTARAFGIKQEVYFLELDLETLCSLPAAAKSFKSLPRFPHVKRDIALVVPDSVPAGKLLEAIDGQSNPYVEQRDIFDVYRGKPIADGYKSIAISLTYRSMEQTLADETVDRIHEKIVRSLMTTFGGRYREGQE